MRWSARTARRRHWHPPAPPPSEQRDAAAPGAGTISRVLNVMAMEKEAMLLVNKFKLDEAPPVNP